MTQTIESTKVIRFLDDAIFQARGIGKKAKADTLQRARDLVYNYYLTQDGFKPAPDIFS